MYVCAQLKNKWDQLKKDWKIWKELKRGDTGLGWDSTRRTIDAPDDWWKDKLKVVPAAKKFRYGGISPELEEKMYVMFSEVVASGDYAWAPNSRAYPSSPDYMISENDDEVEDLSTPIILQDGPRDNMRNYESGGPSHGKRERDLKKTNKVDFKRKKGLEELILSS